MIAAVSVHAELECEGEIRLGTVSRELAERLGAISGEWLEFAPDKSALVVRHVQPGGEPALIAVPAELIAFLDSIPPAERESMPGGALFIRDRAHRLVRLLVFGGELRVQWPRQDWTHSIEVAAGRALASVDPLAARISGRIRLSVRPERASSLTEFIDRFEGLYPEGDVVTVFDGEVLSVELKDVNVGPFELLVKLRELASPLESLDGELEVSSFAHHSADHDFCLTVRGAEEKAVRPSVWKEQV